jgi:hypothetical protein
LLIKRAQERLEREAAHKREKLNQRQQLIDAQASLIGILEDNDDTTQSVDPELESQRAKQQAVLQEVHEQLERTKARNQYEVDEFARVLSQYRTDNREIFEDELQKFKEKRLKIQRELVQHKYERLHKQRAMGNTRRGQK